MRDRPRIGFLFTHKNGDLGAISVTERSYAAPFSEVESHVSDRFCAIIWCSVNTFLDRCDDWNQLRLKLLLFRSEDWNPVHQTLSANRAGTMFGVCERLVPPRDVAAHTIGRTGTSLDDGARNQTNGLPKSRAAKSCIVLSARFSVVNWRSRSVAKSALFRIA